MIVDASFLFDFESAMAWKQEFEYQRLVENLWWQDATKVMPSGAKRERIEWLLSTSLIKDAGFGGNIHFEDLVTQSTEYVNRVANNGLILRRDQLEDLDGNGVQIASEWSTQMGAQMAYWPQKSVVKAILNGENGIAYDGLPYFSPGSSPRLVNPFNPGGAQYANLLTGAPISNATLGSYPGACPIDDSVSVDQAVINLSKAIAYIAGIKMPNGEDPRHLVPKKILCPPRMTPRVQQVTNARYIAQAATSGGGSGDISAIVTNWNFDKPIQVEEFGASFTYSVEDITTGVTSSVSGNDTTYYLLCEPQASSQIGALVYVDRDPFRITYYTGTGGGTGVDAILDRARELEWHVQGRNVTGYGLPYLLFRCKGS